MEKAEKLEYICRFYVTEFNVHAYYLASKNQANLYLRFHSHGLLRNNNSFSEWVQCWIWKFNESI